MVKYAWIHNSLRRLLLLSLLLDGLKPVPQVRSILAQKCQMPFGTLVCKMPVLSAFKAHDVFQILLSSWFSRSITIITIIRISVRSESVVIPVAAKFSLKSNKIKY